MSDVNWKKDMRGEALIQNAGLKVTRKGLEGISLIENKNKGVTPWNHIETIVVDDTNVRIISRKPSQCTEGNLIVKLDNSGKPILDRANKQPLFDLVLRNIFAPLYDKNENGEKVLIDAGRPDLLEKDEVVEMKFSFPKTTMDEDTGDAIRLWRDFYTKIQLYQRQSKFLGGIDNEVNPDLPATPVYSLNIPTIQFTENAIEVLKQTEDAQYFINTKNLGGIETPKYKTAEDLYRFVYNKEPELNRIAVEV